jgi:hypothetical protein
VTFGLCQVKNEGGTILTQQGSQKALLVMEKMHLEIANDQKKDTSERTLTLIHLILFIDGDLIWGS